MKRITKSVVVVKDKNALFAALDDLVTREERDEILGYLQIVSIARVLSDASVSAVRQSDDYFDYEMDRMNRDLGSEIAKFATVTDEDVL
jgi:hypothetical protein